MSPTMNPSSALNQEASADASSSWPCLRTRAPRKDLPDSRCCLHTDLSSGHGREKGGGGCHQSGRNLSEEPGRSLHHELDCI